VQGGKQRSKAEAAAETMAEHNHGPALGPALIDAAVLAGAGLAPLSRFGAGDAGSILAYRDGEGFGTREIEGPRRAKGFRRNCWRDGTRCGWIGWNRRRRAGS